jgi:hypothetical protein
MLSKKSRTACKERYPIWVGVCLGGLGVGLTAVHHKLYLVTDSVTVGTVLAMIQA